MRSGTTVCSTAWSSSTPSMVMVDDPAPRIWAPMWLSIAARSASSGSRAALSMTVVPLARTAAISAFSVAPTLGNSSRMRAPVSWAARACT